MLGALILAHLLAGEGADQRQPRDLARPPVGDRPGQVAAVGVANDQERLLPDDVIDQPEQRVQDGVGAVDRLRCGGATHAGQVGVDAPVPGPLSKHWLQGTRNLPVVDLPAVQRQDGRAGAVLGVVDRNAVHHRIHGD